MPPTLQSFIISTNGSLGGVIKLNKSKKLKSTKKLFRKNQPLLFILGFAAIAVLALVIVRAAPYTRNFEAESASRSGNATVASESGTSNGSLLRFNQPSGNPPVTTGRYCNLYLHGAGQQGNSTDRQDGDVFWAMPRSPNGAFWEYDGPHNYQQTPQTGEAEYQALRSFLANYVSSRSCGPTTVHGGSNGGGLAAKLYCRGEDFGGRVWAYIVDDPVMDRGVVGCSPSPNITRTYFTHSDELRDEAADTVLNHGGNCSQAGWGWYCEDNRTMTLQEYNSHIGTQSVRTCATHSGGGCDYLLTASHMIHVIWDEYN